LQNGVAHCLVAPNYRLTAPNNGLAGANNGLPGPNDGLVGPNNYQIDFGVSKTLLFARCFRFRYS